MPDITSSGTYTKANVGFAGLAATKDTRAFLIDGTIGTSLTIQYTDDQGTARTVENGAITTLPKSFNFTGNIDLEMVSVGSPNLNVMIAK